MLCIVSQQQAGLAQAVRLALQRAMQGTRTYYGIHKSRRANMLKGLALCFMGAPTLPNGKDSPRAPPVSRS